MKPFLLKLSEPFRATEGTLRALELEAELGFLPQRVYWISDVPRGAVRGNHAHKELTQFILMLSGSVTVTIKTPDSETRFALSSSNEGLVVPPGFWREMSNFSSDGLMFVFASLPFDENDYIREWSDYVSWNRSHG